MQSAQGVEILLVEDNPDDVELTLHAFKRYHISNSVHVVGDGAEALEFLYGTGAYTGREGAPKLILLDLKLPKVSGIEVLRQVKADSRFIGKHANALGPDVSVKHVVRARLRAG